MISSLYFYPTVFPSEDLIEAEQPLPPALHANPILSFAAFATSQHDIRLCDHVNTRGEQHQELLKMEKTQADLLPHYSRHF